MNLGYNILVILFQEPVDDLAAFVDEDAAPPVKKQRVYPALEFTPSETVEEEESAMDLSDDEGSRPSVSSSPAVAKPKPKSSKRTTVNPEYSPISIAPSPLPNLK